MDGKKGKKFGKKELLLEAALTEFSDYDYDNASLNRILENSGVGKGNFYYHFKNKETLFLALVKRILHLKLEFLAGRKPELTGDEDVFALLRIHGRLSEEFALTDPRIEGFIYHLAGELPAALRGKVNSLMGRSGSSYFRDLVTSAVERGEIREDLPPAFVEKLLAFLFTNFAKVFVHTDRYNEPDRKRILDDFDRYMDFIEAGLSSGRAPRE